MSIFVCGKINMLINNLLENSATKYPDKIAVIHDADRVTYSQLNTQADNLASHLLAQGINKGDRVAILLENNIDYITAYYATLKIGAVASPLNPGLKPDAFQHLLNHLEPTTIITNFKAERLLKATDLSVPTLKSIIIRTPKQKWSNTPFTISPLEDIVTNPTPHLNAAGHVSVSLCESVANFQTQDALASIIYTSGSTGEPKGVMLSHANIVANTHSICESLSIAPSDIQMVVLPFFYVMGKSLLNTHIAAGATLVLSNRFMYPADVVNQMIEENVTSFSGVPSTYAYLLNRSPFANSKEKLTQLRYCSQAGGHMAKTLKLELRKALPDQTKIVIMYGATEASARLTYLPPDDFETKIESIGKAIPNVTIRVVDEQNREVVDGQEGTLVAAGPNIMMGYWKDSQDTNRVLTKVGYHTGDIGYRDPEGFLYVTGRKDGLLKVSGHRVNPVEIEDTLMATDLLIETVVVGIPDELMGNKLIALLVSKDDAVHSENLLERCAADLPRHKLPARIISVRALPKNASGKIDRQSCMKLALSKTT